ncbi:MAG TPA: hypothetical protein VKZ65_08845 [Glycomyces sp.]|nr:hypothetical protein [Glycomyces sp.]
MIRHMRFLSLIAGPLLMAVSTFLWEADGRYGVWGGVVIMAANALWIYGLLGVWERIAAWKPWAGGIGILLALGGCVGGIAFGLQGFFEGLFAVSGEASLAAAEAHPLAAALVLWVPGPLMPASLFALGLDLALAKLAPRWMAAMLMASAAVFPLSRITRTEAIAHLADVFILLAFAALAVHYLRGGMETEGGAATRLETPTPRPAL